MAQVDSIVIGAGTAGLTAAAAVARGGGAVVVVERLMAGGQVATIEEIANFPGHDSIAGFEIGPLLMEAAEEAGAEVRLGEVTSLTPEGEGWRVTLEGEDLFARTVVLAMGSTRRALGLPQEEALRGFGVSHCASCDGAFFRERDVVVAGGGDSAFDEALVLAAHARLVTIVCEGAPTARAEAREKIAARGNVAVLQGHRVTAILGAGQVAGVTVTDLATGTARDIACEGLFTYIGLDPATGWLPAAIARDDGGHVVVDDTLATSAQGVFAAGDLRAGSAAMLWQARDDGLRAAASVLSALGRAP